MGDVGTAASVGELTRTAGLQISTYGSYYRVGSGEDGAPSFDKVLQTALALKAPAIRVWAGAQGSDACAELQRARIIAETLRIAEPCAGAGVDLVFEYHSGTLTDSNASAVAFADAVRHPAVFFGWQPVTGATVSENLDGLRNMLPRLATLHVFNWSKNVEGGYVRRPLAEAAGEWRRYFELIASTGRDHVALLEFVRDDAVDQCEDDARALKELLHG